jgi:hypothetical protein
MKKHNIAQRRLVLRKEAIQTLSLRDLDAAIGGIESNTLPTLCFDTFKTCASGEFAC